MQVIIFKSSDNAVRLIQPNPVFVEKIGIEAIAKKDTPHGRPYWIVNLEDLPSVSSMPAWEIDEIENTPHGFGGEGYDFESEALEVLNAS